MLTSSECAGAAQYSLLTWLVAEIEAVKSWLEQRGVRFEDYDFGDTRSVNGIAELGGDRMAWFKDSEGNLLTIAEVH